MALFQRKQDYIPRVAAVHDLCGYGKCSLGIAIPVLSAGGCDVCPVPTGIFSSHTAFPGWYMHDTTGILSTYLDAWEGINVQIDAIYSGFLGDPRQVDIIRRLYAEHPNALRVVDPVMADHGMIYPTYTPQLCSAMVDLARDADILTPNLTEAAIILGCDWPGENISDDHAKCLVEGLLHTGAKNVVLKGIKREKENIVHNYIGEQNGSVSEVHNSYLPYMLHGTGDLYCSVLMSAVMVGQSLVSAAQFAGEIVRDAMELSALQPDFRARGVSFEPLLGRIFQLKS